MCWTANPASGRNWRDYYAGDVVIDVLAWDCYNAAARQGVYAPPAQIFDRVRSISESAGKPWGVAEFGSLLVTGDDGSARAAWLRSAVEYLRDNRALFVTYFDVKLRLDYRLRDAFSQAAWRDAVQGQWD